MSPLRAALFLIAAIGTSHGAESLVEIARWPDLVAQAKDHGVDYPAVVERAERGDTKALHTIFSLTPHTDGSGATCHAAVLRRLLERLGDRSFSRALQAEPRDLRDRVMQKIDFDFGRPWRKAFPITYALGSHDTSLLRGD
jgi:hypothetical protein